MIPALTLAAAMAAGCGADHMDVDLPAAEPTASGKCGIDGFPAPTLCIRSGADSILDHATHIVILDESESMVRNRERRNYWIPAIKAIRARHRNLPKTARMEVYLFSGHVTHRGEATDALLNSLRATSPQGANTDLGRAAEAAANQIIAHPLDEPLFISILTDGEHDPPRGSPFGRQCSGAAWTDLAARSTTAASQRPVIVDFVQIGSADVGCLRDVFPDARVCSADSADDIARCVAWGKAQMAIRYIEWRFARDTTAVAGMIRTAGTVETTHHRPVSAGFLAETGRTLVDTCWAGTASPLPNGGSIAPRGCLPAASFGPVSLEGDLGNGDGRWYDWLLPKGVRQTPVAGDVVLEAMFEPRVELLAIGLPATRPGDVVTVDLQFAAGGILPLWGYTLIGLGLLGLAGLIVWMLLPPIPPKFKPLTRMAEHGYMGRIDLERFCRQRHTYAIPMPGATPSAGERLIVEVRRMSRLRPRKNVVVRVHHPEIQDVQIGVMSKKRRPLRLHRIRDSTDLELPGMIVWDPPAVPWDEQPTYAEVRDICMGYEVKIQ